MGELYAEVLEARNIFQWATASISLLTYDDMDVDAIHYEEMRGVYDTIKGLFCINSPGRWFDEHMEELSKLSLTLK